MKFINHRGHSAPGGGVKNLLHYLLPKKEGGTGVPPVIVFSGGRCAALKERGRPRPHRVSKRAGRPHSLTLSSIVPAYSADSPRLSTLDSRLSTLDSRLSILLTNLYFSFLL